MNRSDPYRFSQGNQPGGICIFTDGYPWVNVYIDVENPQKAMVSLEKWSTNGGISTSMFVYRKDQEGTCFGWDDLVQIKKPLKKTCFQTTNSMFANSLLPMARNAKPLMPSPQYQYISINSISPPKTPLLSLVCYFFTLSGGSSMFGIGVARHFLVLCFPLVAPASAAVNWQAPSS